MFDKQEIYALALTISPYMDFSIYHILLLIFQLSSTKNLVVICLLSITQAVFFMGMGEHKSVFGFSHPGTGDFYNFSISSFVNPVILEIFSMGSPSFFNSLAISRLPSSFPCFLAVSSTL
jgi:hypothetical protein